MNRKVYLGITTFIICICGVTAFLLMRNTNTEPKRVYIHVEPSMENPPPAEPGYKWVWHNNHWDKVPIVQNPIIDTDVLPESVPKHDDTDHVTSEDTDFHIPKPIEIHNNPGEIDISNPNFSMWMHKHKKAAADMMTTSRLLMETGGSTAKEFITNVDNMTDKEKKALAELLIRRMKLDEASIKSYNEVARDKPVK